MYFLNELLMSLRSLFQKLSDEQIEEGINELDNEHFQNVSDDELIKYKCTVLVTKVEKVA